MQEIDLIRHRGVSSGTGSRCRGALIVGCRRNSLRARAGSPSLFPYVGRDSVTDRKSPSGQEEVAVRFGFAPLLLGFVCES